MDTNKMIQRLVNKGANPAEAVKLLNELMAIHEGNNLIVALRYFNFITDGQAEKLAAAA